MSVAEHFVEITAEALGAQLAQSVKARAAMPGAGVTGFAATMAIDPERLRDELAYLSIVTMHFCVSAGLAPDVAPRVLAAYYRELWTRDAWRARSAELDARTPAYETALNYPHPDYGRGYGMGRAFARLCGATHDLPVIEFGARAYVEQLPPILTLLRGVVVK
jgi:hypothetical protein